MAEAIVTKRCCHCNEFKPISEFWKNRSAADGLQYRCKACQAAATHACQTTERGRALCRIRALAHQKTAKGRASAERQRIRQRDTGMSKARDAVKFAVRTGKLPRVSTLSCPCGKQAQHYHHHLGYSREHRLDVLPLCAVCHKAADAKRYLSSSTTCSSQH